jgi:serine/threonine protein kinase
VIGTLNYLSPEALNGFELDERSDIWAFGVVLYEMLAGHLPFEANTMTSLITTIPDQRTTRFR